MAEFIKDLLNRMIQHSSNLIQFLELGTKWVVLLMSLIILAGTVLATRRLSKHYYAKYRKQKKGVSEEYLTKHLINYQVARGSPSNLKFYYQFYNISCD